MRVLIALFFCNLSFAGTYYATPNGAGSQNGTSEANAWSYSQAFANAVAGDTVYLKAGLGGTNYKQLNNGTNGSPIVFIGYTTTPGDIVPQNYSTFTRTNTSTYPASSVYPTFAGTDARYPENPLEIGLDIFGDFVEVHNVLTTDNLYGIKTNNVSNTKLINVISDSDHYAITINGTAGALIEDCYALNSGGNAISLSNGTTGSTVKDCYVMVDELALQHGNDANSGTGYYFAASNASSGNLFENNIANRAVYTAHQGHGFIAKAGATNNVWQNSIAYNTGIEANFDGVTGNTWQNIEIYGTYSQRSLEFSSCIRNINGAHDNLYKNIYIEDTRYAFEFQDFDDGYTSPYDNDADQGGLNNTFINIVVNRMNQLIAYTEGTGSNGNATSSGNKFYNCTFYNHTGGGPAITSRHFGANPTFINVIYDTSTAPALTEAIGNGVISPTWSHSNFSNKNFASPSGTNITAHTPGFVGPLTSDSGFALTVSSSLIDIGNSVAAVNADYAGIPRPQGAAYDIGAFEYSSGGGDITPPSLVSSSVFDIGTNQAFVSWNVNEPSKGRVFYDTQTRADTIDYSFATTLENNFLTFHSQPIGNNPSNLPFLSPNTTYYFRIKMEDASGNDSQSSEFNFTTLSAGDPTPTPPAGSVEGIRSRFAKRKKFQ